MTQHGLSGWSFGYNRRKRSLGLCRYEEKRIELSIYFVTNNSLEAVEDTILHEIAHALAGPEAGHGEHWKRVCRQIGAIPERCDSTARMPKGHWRGVCAKCGLEYTRYRRPLRNRQYACRSCGPTTGKIVFRLHKPASVQAD